MDAGSWAPVLCAVLHIRKHPHCPFPMHWGKVSSWTPLCCFSQVHGSSGRFSGKSPSRRCVIHVWFLLPFDRLEFLPCLLCWEWIWIWVVRPYGSGQFCKLTRKGLIASILSLEPGFFKFLHAEISHAVILNVWSSYHQIFLALATNLLSLFNASSIQDPTGNQVRCCLCCHIMAWCPPVSVGRESKENSLLPFMFQNQLF